MDAKRTPGVSGVREPQLVFCRRIESRLPVEEHRNCPYCFGGEAAIRSGRHEAFCDFRPGKDPICFGFPEDFGRYAR